ncbi:hypothetical protein [Sphingomonas sp. CARO-RG-8B-R24-01]|uniref:hypothetical protein n=1 Tax=Sphingomonas sp. CARO-RG-8B-R24-01 TaxID=2914831 RepID=UPI001F5A84AD|nr:hypothetical protein [Sphingomonas sp. CARO-RG-8B-R24-01]
MSFLHALSARPLGKLALAAAALTATVGLSACNEGYGYSGVSVGYASAGWDPYYGGYTGDPYWGWNNDYYYPGTGYYVYDRGNRRHRWNDQQRGYWQGRSQGWRGANREMRPMWRDYGMQGRPGRGGFGGGRPGGGRPGGGRPHR